MLKLDATEFPQSLRDLRHLGIDFPHPLSEAAAFQIDHLAATGTGELVMLFEPSESLAVLVVAARTGNVDRCAVELSRHNVLPLSGDFGQSVIRPGLQGKATPLGQHPLFEREARIQQHGPALDDTTYLREAQSCFRTAIVEVVEQGEMGEPDADLGQEQRLCRWMTPE